MNANHYIDAHKENNTTYEPQRPKKYPQSVRQTTIWISLRIRIVWSYSSLGAFR